MARLYLLNKIAIDVYKVQLDQQHNATNMLMQTTK